MTELTRRTAMTKLLAVTALAPAAAACAQEPAEVIDLWPAGPPGGKRVRVRQVIADRPNPQGLPDRAATGIRHPTLTVFRSGKPDGSAILLIPGGGYQRVVIDKEGFEMARWLAERGVTAFVLLYRLPSDGWEAGPDAPLQDAQRAIRLIRRFQGVDAERVAVQGFSAGGHLAGRLATQFDRQTYAPVDESDRLSARPDVSAMIYPVVTMGEAAHTGSRERLLGAFPAAEALRAHSLENTTSAAMPPLFLLHASDDASVPVENSLLMYAATRRAGAPVEMHVFEEGGHGFGLRFTEGKPVAVWPQLFLSWWDRHGRKPAR